MNLVTIDTAPGNMSMYIAPNNTSYLELGKNASTIQIGPLTQNTGAPNVSTSINGVRIDSNWTNNNLIVTASSSPYSVNNTPSTNYCNTIVSNIAFTGTTPMTGDHCTAVGHNTLTKNSIGTWNTAIGADTLSNVTTGRCNTALGGYALTLATTNSSNVAIGFNALAKSVTSTNPNVAVGFGALQNFNNTNVGGGGNTAIGYNALAGLTTGTGNLALGFIADNLAGSGSINTIGNDNTIIGNSATSSGFSNTIVIGKGAIANANDQIILGGQSGGHTTWIQGSGGLQVNTGPTSLQNTYVAGNLGVGTSTPIRKFSVTGKVSIGDNSHDAGEYGTVNICSDSKSYPQLSLIRAGSVAWQIGTIGTNNNFIIFNGATGVQMSTGGTSWSAYSDRNLKTNFENIVDPIEKINKIKGVYYKFKTDTPEEIRRVGVIAQDVQTVLPEAITELFKNDEPYLGVKYTELIPLLIEGIKSQQIIIDSHKKEIEDLKSRLSAIEARLAAAGI